MFLLGTGARAGERKPRILFTRVWRGCFAGAEAEIPWFLGLDDAAAAPPIRVVEREGEVTLVLGWPVRLSERDVPEASEADLRAAGRDPNLASRLGGRFALVHVSADGFRLTSDIASTLPVFTSFDPDGCLATDDMRGVARSVRLTPDHDALLDLLLFEHLLGDRTLWRDWSRVAPRTQLVYAPGGAPSFRARVLAGPMRNTSSDRPIDLNDSVDACLVQLQSYLSRLMARAPLLALTGGVDSRTVSAVAHAVAPGAYRTVTHGLTGSGDRRIAARIATQLGVGHIPVATEELLPARFGELTERLLDLSNGQTTVMWAHLVAVNEIVQRETQTVVNGAGGECARGFYYYDSLRRPASAEAGVLRRAPGRVTLEALARLFGTDRRAIEDHMRRRLRHIFAPDHEMGMEARTVAMCDRLDRFYLRERLGHTVAASHVISDRSRLETHAPFLLPPFIDLSLRMDPALRRRGHLHELIQRRFAPFLLEIPTDHALPQFPGSRRGLFLAKAARRIRRVAGIGTAPPVHAYGRLFANELRSEVTHILSKSRLLQIGLEPLGVDQLLAATEAGEKGAAAALGNLLGVVGWHHRWVASC